MDTYSSLPSELRVRRDGAVRVLTLHRPEQRNAFNAALHEALANVWLMLDDDLEARAVLIRAEGDVFSAGGDYEWFAEQQRDRRVMELAFRDGHRILDRMIQCRLPIVSAIQGGAVGLGASIGILSDLVVMSEDAFYRDPHVAIGLVAADGGIAWPMSTSLQIAKQYVLLGDRLPAQEAYRLGMVNKVVPRASLDDTASDFARRLSELPLKPAQATKRALNLLLERSIRGIAEYALASEMLTMTDPSFEDTVAGLRGSKSSPT